MAKVCVLANSLGYLANFRRHFLLELLEKGHEVIACAPEDGADVSVLKQAGVKLICLPLSRSGVNPFAELVTLYRLYQTFKQHRPDVLFNNTIKPVIYGSIAARLARVPKVGSCITGLGYAFMTKSLKGRVVNKVACVLYRLAFKKNKVVFFQNQDDANLFLGKRLLAKSKIRLVAGSGIDTQYFSPVPLPQAPGFLLVARLIKDKGIVEYIEAARLVKAKHPEALFHLVGGLDCHPSAISKSELDGWINEGVVSYHGQLSDVRPMIKAASVYVLPSYREGTPRSTLEAMAMGRAVITTDVPGCRETIEDGVNGYRVPVKHVTALAEAMCDAIEHPKKVKKMGQASRALVEKKFAIEKVNHAMMSAMELC